MTDEQVSTYYCLLRELMMYTNKRLGVVVDFDLTSRKALEDPSLDEKCQLVLQEIWRDAGIIDDFARDCARIVPPYAIAVARQWKHALFGVFTVLGMRDGLVLMQFDDAVFAVTDVTGDLVRLANFAAVVETALLPYEGRIVSQYPLRVLSSSDEGALLDNAEVAAGLAKTPVASTAEEFVPLADALRERMRSEELDYMLNGSEKDDDPVEGFHRGVLFGKREEEREALAEQEVRRIFQDAMDKHRDVFRARYLKHPVGRTLGEALSALTKYAVEDIARRAGLRGYSGRRKADLVGMVAREIPSPDNEDALPFLVITSSDIELKLVDELLRSGGEKAFVDGEGPLAPDEPLSFAYREGGSVTAFVPEELRCERLANLVSAELYDRGLVDEAASVLDAFVFLYGAVELSEAYRRYRSFVKDPVDFDQFRSLAAGEGELCLTDIWDQHGVEYVVHYDISEEQARRDALDDARIAVLRESGKMPADGVPQGDDLLHAYLRQTDPDEDRALAERAAPLYKRYLSQCEGYIAHLIEEHSRVEPKPLDRCLVEHGPMEYACGTPEGKALRNYLDGMVPDGENDYLFADRAMEEIVHAMIGGGTLEGAFDVLSEYGFDDRAPYAYKLVRLLNNFYGSLPSWENNGWTPREVTEKITGRKIFYAPDGSLLRPGRNDPCPCGSGKKYKKCCGR